MNAAVILIIGIVILALGYVFYGGWLSKQWGIDPSRSTPAQMRNRRFAFLPILLSTTVPMDWPSLRTELL